MLLPLLHVFSKDQEKRKRESRKMISMTRPQVFFFNGTLMASEWLRVRLLGFFVIGPSGEPVKLG